MTCPTVIADCTLATWRRTSAASPSAPRSRTRRSTPADHASTTASTNSVRQGARERHAEERESL